MQTLDYRWRRWWRYSETRYQWAYDRRQLSSGGSGGRNNRPPKRQRAGGGGRAMSDPTFEVDMNKLANSITFNVRFVGQRRFGLRMRLGIRVIALAAWIMGVNIHIDSRIELS